MKSITIHNIDDHLHRMVQEKARAEGLSLNKTIHALLEEALGVKPRNLGKHYDEFKEFCGVWSEQEVLDFEEQTREFRQVHPEDWK